MFMVLILLFLLLLLLILIDICIWFNLFIILKLFLFTVCLIDVLRLSMLRRGMVYSIFVIVSAWLIHTIFVKMNSIWIIKVTLWHYPKSIVIKFPPFWKNRLLLFLLRAHLFKSIIFIKVRNYKNLICEFWRFIIYCLNSLHLKTYFWG